MVEVWGLGDNNDVPVIDLYGWSELSGHHIGTITLAMGNFVTGSSTGGGRLSDGAHQSIRDAFDVSTAYRGCDVYTETNDYQNTITVYTGEADFPGHFVVDFVNTQYKWFGIAVTNLGTPAATDVGAIYRPLSMKKGGVSPQLTS